jgi:hypothetical protein
MLGFVRVQQQSAPPRRLVLLVALPIVIGTFIAIRLLIGPGIFAQTAAWPTSPPGPEFPVPSAQQADTSIASSVAQVGSEVEFIPAAWPGPLPLVPPIPSARITFDETKILPVTLEIDAGTFGTAVQLRLTPVAAALLPGLDGLPLQAFNLEAFGMTGEPMTQPPQRSIKLEMQVSSLIGVGVSIQDLLFVVSTPAGIQWVATSARTSNQTVHTRLAHLGTIYLVQAGSP